MPAIKCSKCGEHKDVSQFHKGNKKHGYHSYCKPCNLIRKHQYRKEQRQWIAELRKTMCCAVCGENHPATLDFHHLDPDTKKFNVGHAITTGVSRGRVIEEMSKCSILCSNCHRIQQYEQKREGLPFPQ